MSKFFKGKKSSKPVEPRALDVTTKECNQACWELGQIEYQIFILKQAAQETNNRIQRLNNEGAARKKLDAAKQEELAKTAPKQAEAQNEQRA